MRADEHALVALDANRRIPYGDIEGEVAFFEAGGGGGPGAVDRNGADGKVVAVVGEQAGGDLFDKFGGTRINGWWDDDGVGIGLRRKRDFLHAGESSVHGGVVHLDDGLALAAVGFVDGFFDLLDGFVLREHAGEGEEARLQHSVGAAAHTAGLGDGGGVDNEEPEFLFNQRDLPIMGKLRPRIGG